TVERGHQLTSGGGDGCRGGETDDVPGRYCAGSKLDHHIADPRNLDEIIGAESRGHGPSLTAVDAHLIDDSSRFNGSAEREQDLHGVGSVWFRSRVCLHNRDGGALEPIEVERAHLAVLGLDLV